MPQPILFVDAFNLTARLRHVYWPDGIIYDGGDFRLVRRFLYSFTKIVEEIQPSKILLAADAESYERTTFFPEYKSHRNPCPIYNNHKALCVKLIERTLPVTTVSIPGYEADDLMAFYAEESNDPITIISTDSDLLQIVQRFPGRVSLFNPVKHENTTIKYGDIDYITFKALTGDPADNVPSVTGEKTALKLLRGEMDMDEWLDGGTTRTEKMLRRDVFQRNLKIVSLFDPHTIMSKPPLPPLEVKTLNLDKMRRICTHKLNLGEWVESDEFERMIMFWQSWYGKRMALKQGVFLRGKKIQAQN